jgi:hypothetical protein
LCLVWANGAYARCLTRFSKTTINQSGSYLKVINEYKSKGYVLCKNFVSTEKLKALETVLISFHEAWTEAHKEFYESQAVNSAYLTGTKYLSSDQRMTLFSFVCQEKLLQFASALIPEVLHS